VARIKHLGVRLSAAEFLRVASAAEAASMNPAAWVRLAALRAADGASAPSAQFSVPPLATPPERLTQPAHTRFTDEQMEALASHAYACGLPVSAFIRQVVLGVKPIARLPDARAAIVAVNRVGNNLNQLVKLANSGMVLTPDLLRAVREVLAELHVLREALFRADAARTSEASE
jgi:hypothetical protein